MSLEPQQKGNAITNTPPLWTIFVVELFMIVYLMPTCRSAMLGRYLMDEGY